MITSRTRIVALAGALAALGALGGALTGCGSSAQLAMSHRLTPSSEARIVVLPVDLPEDLADGVASEGRTLARLYSTELLRAYEVLDYDRFRTSLDARAVTLDSLLTGDAAGAAEELGVDGVLQSEVYRWNPGTPGFWFLAKSGQVGFHARLVDVRTGSVIWSVNRVRDTRPNDTLAVGLGPVFEDIAGEMPSYLTPY